MILTKEEILSIIPKTHLQDQECLNLIQTYIKEKTGININKINNPDSFTQVQLMQIAFSTSVKFFAEKYHTELSAA